LPEITVTAVSDEEWDAIAVPKKGETMRRITDYQLVSATNEFNFNTQARYALERKLQPDGPLVVTHSVEKVYTGSSVTSERTVTTWSQAFSRYEGE
jgi:hypothetical protein